MDYGKEMNPDKEIDYTLYYNDCVKVVPALISDDIDLAVSDPPYPDYYTEEFSYNDRLINVFELLQCRQFIFWSAKVDFPLSYTARHIWDKITGAACQYDFIYERNGGKRQKVFRGHRINSTVSASFARETFYNHKSQKPLNVLVDIIKFSKTTKTVIDPFMGSGSTGVACKRLGRKFIGIEKDKKYYEIAKQRIEETLL